MNTIHPLFKATLDLMAGYSPSKVMADFDRRQTVAKSDPLLAFAYFAEAVADRRIFNDQDGLSLLATLAERAREAVAEHTGRPFANTLYPRPADESVR